MTTDEAELRKMALDLMVLASEWQDAETRIAAWLASYRASIRRMDAGVCLYAAGEWRRDRTDNVFRLRSAEACELCAYRIDPSSRGPGAPPPKSEGGT